MPSTHTQVNRDVHERVSLMIPTHILSRAIDTPSGIASSPLRGRVFIYGGPHAHEGKNACIFPRHIHCQPEPDDRSPLSSVFNARHQLAACTLYMRALYVHPLFRLAVFQ